MSALTDTIGTGSQTWITRESAKSQRHGLTQIRISGEQYPDRRLAKLWATAHNLDNALGPHWDGTHWCWVVCKSEGEA